MARWPSAHSERLKDFIGAACFVAVSAADGASATFRPGAIFCTPAVTTRSPAAAPETSTSSLR